VSRCVLEQKQDFLIGIQPNPTPVQKSVELGHRQPSRVAESRREAWLIHGGFEPNKAFFQMDVDSHYLVEFYTLWSQQGRLKGGYGACPQASSHGFDAVAEVALGHHPIHHDSGLRSRLHLGGGFHQKGPGVHSAKAPKS
jgi:hypothetical protein